MQVILLAAGQSSRLKPLSDKNLLPFCGKTLIEHQVASLKEVEFNKIIVVGNRSNLPSFESIFADDSKVSIVEQTNANGQQAEGVMAGAEKVTEDQVMIMSTNDVFDPSLFKQVLQKADDENVDGVIAGKEVSSYFPGGYLSLDEEGLITDIVEKPGEGNEPSHLVNLICHVYKDFPKFLTKLKNSTTDKSDLYEVALDAYIKDGAKIIAEPYSGFWQPIKYPWHVLKVMNYFLEKQTAHTAPDAEIAETAVIRGNVVIESGVKVFDHAVIQGPAYIGKNSIVANNALVRNSMVGEKSVVGYGTEIARSYLKGHVWTHSNYVGDSVLDENISFGAGAVTGNLRHDEKSIKVTIKGERIDSGETKLGAIIGQGTRIGINSSSNPGVKIGQHCFIGGGVLVSRDVEDGKKVCLKQDLVVGENEERVDTEERRNIT